MSEQDNQGQPPAAGQSIDNFKQEFSRKLNNYEAKLSEMAEANKALLNRLSDMTTPKATEEDGFDKLWYDDPKKAAARIQAETEASIMAKMNKQQEVQAKTSQTLSQLVSDYPELNNSSDPLTMKAVEIYNNLSDSDKTSPMAYKLAVKEAAADLGVLPVKKRESYDSDIYSSRGGVSTSSAKASKKEELDPRTIAFAKMVGLNTEDPATMESLKNRAKRQSWHKYE